MLIVTLSEKADWKNCATAFTVATKPVGAVFTLESKLRLMFIGLAPIPDLVSLRTAVSGASEGTYPHFLVDFPPRKLQCELFRSTL
jgi:hypothetical protein